jgi:hypothetical protein
MLQGVICCQTGLPESFKTCQCKARERGCLFPLPLIDTMAKNEASREGAGWSATTILGCARQNVLKLTEPYHESPAEYHARWRGEGVHLMAEQHGPYDGVVQEVRISKSIDVDGELFTITGKPDWYDVVNRHLDDWKSTKVCPKVVYDDHKYQVNIYAWLIDGGTWSTGEISDVTPDTASIIYIDPSRSVTLEVELWSTDAVEALIRRKLAPVKRYQDTGELPEGVADKGPEAWRHRFCPFRGTGKCCGDNIPLN